MAGFGQSLTCVPFPIDSEPNTTAISEGIPVMAFKYASGEELAAVYKNDLADKKIECTRCHTSRSTVV